MRGYIIERYNNMNNAYTSSRFVEEGKRAGISFEIIGVNDTYMLENCLYNNGKLLEKAEVGINRFKYGNLKNNMADLCGVCINSAEKINRYVDKSRQLSDIKSDFIKIPKSMLANIGTNFEIIADNVGLPFVAKGLCGSQGNQVFLVENKADYAELCVKFNGEMLFQQFIKTSSGRDVRFLSVGGKVTACMQRSAKQGFKANFALGAEVSAYPIDNKIEKIAQEIYRITGADILGIDLLFGNDDYYFCEINITPGIEGVENATGINVAGEIIQYLKDKYDRK